ncbi:MAG: hypothetical protein R2851_25035 [Caldilineaceae bacterium]
MDPAYDVLVYGPVFCDIIFTDLPSLPVLGTEIFAGDLTATVGGSAIVAAGLHRLARVGLIADLGADPFSAIIRSVLDDIGLERTLIREHPIPCARPWRSPSRRTGPSSRASRSWPPPRI